MTISPRSRYFTPPAGMQATSGPDPLRFDGVVSLEVPRMDDHVDPSFGDYAHKDGSFYWYRYPGEWVLRGEWPEGA